MRQKYPCSRCDGSVLALLLVVQTNVPLDGLDRALGSDVVGDWCGDGRDEDRGGLSRHHCSEESNGCEGESRETHFVSWS